MVRQVIVSPLLEKRGPLSPNIWRKLLIRGGGAQVDEALKRNGWNGVKPVLTTVITSEVTTGVIRGVRFEAKGKLDDVKVQASDLWTDAETGIVNKTMTTGALPRFKKAVSVERVHLYTDSSVTKNSKRL